MKAAPAFVITPARVVGHEEALRSIDEKKRKAGMMQEHAYQKAVACKSRGDVAGGKHQLLIRRACMQAIGKLDRIRTSLVVSQVHQLAVGGMQAYTAAMKDAPSLEDVEDVVDATQEATDSLSEVNRVLKAGIVAEEGEDADLEMEFQMLQAEAEAPLPDLPPPPTGNCEEKALLLSRGAPSQQPRPGPRTRNGFHQLVEG